MTVTWLHIALLLGLAVGLGFAAGPLVASFLIAPKARGGAMEELYECGMPAIGHASDKLSLSYSIYALLFLSFDVDVIYLFPVAAAYAAGPTRAALTALVVFLLILGLALIHFEKKGVFSWPRRVSL